MKVYAVYSIPKSPEYRLEKLFKTKEGAKEFIKTQKNRYCEFGPPIDRDFVFDIQIEEIEE
jgi:hypothetical protein